MNNFIGHLDITKVESQLNQLRALSQNIALSSNSYLSNCVFGTESF